MPSFGILTLHPEPPGTHSAVLKHVWYVVFISSVRMRVRRCKKIACAEEGSFMTANKTNAVNDVMEVLTK